MGNLPFEILQWTLALAGVWLISGTLMNFSSHPHWYIRGWDFPRVRSYTRRSTPRCRSCLTVGDHESALVFRWNQNGTLALEVVRHS
jgi:hypothetical protein